MILCMKDVRTYRLTCAWHALDLIEHVLELESASFGTGLTRYLAVFYI